MTISETDETHETEKDKLLYLDLEWPSLNSVKRCGLEELESRWEQEDGWRLLAQLRKIRRIDFGETAYESFGRKKWF